jgi:ligand-binding sensor domain-containing protein
VTAKSILAACFLAIMFISNGCKKEAPVILPNATGSVEAYPEWTNYTKSNSKLPDDQVNAIAIDQNDTKWIGTANGLACIKGKSWTIYDTGNSPLPSANVQALAVEKNGTVWIGTDKGLAKYDGTHWDLYTVTNSIIPKIDNANRWQLTETYNILLSMAVDHDGALWLGEFNSVAFIGMIKKYQNGQWTTYRLDQMGYTSALPYAIQIDMNNQPIALLAGTAVKAIIRFNGSTWNEIDKPEKARGFRTMALQNSDIWVGGATFFKAGNKDASIITLAATDSPILSMAIDAQSKKWLGTFYGGLVIHNGVKP